MPGHLEQLRQRLDAMGHLSGLRRELQRLLQLQRRSAGQQTDCPDAGIYPLRHSEKDWGYGWARIDERFDTFKHPNEPNRNGYVVEIDPKDPSSTPKKRTALGRFKHENAEMVINGDGRVVVYMGDDERGEFLYRYVSDGVYAPGAPTDSLTRGRHDLGRQVQRRRHRPVARVDAGDHRHGLGGGDRHPHPYRWVHGRCDHHGSPGMGRGQSRARQRSIAV